MNAQIECVTTVVSENDTHKFVCESTANFLMCVAMISQGRVWAGSTFSSGEFFCEQWGCDLSAWTLSDRVTAFTLCHCFHFISVQFSVTVWNSDSAVR